MDLCSFSLESNHSVLLTPDDIDFAVLEKLGFIVTTDIKDFIAIKVKGFFVQGEEVFFCIKQGKHE